METQPMTKQEKQRISSKKYREASRDAILAKQAEYRKLTRNAAAVRLLVGITTPIILREKSTYDCYKNSRKR